MSIAVKHPVLDRVEPSFVIFDIWALWRSDSDAQPWASECPDVKNYKWRLNPVWHRMQIVVHIWQQWASKGQLTQL